MAARKKSIPEQLRLFRYENHPVGKPDDAVQIGGSDSSYIVYVDESGDHSIESIDSAFPVFVLAFCVFHKKYYAEHVVPSVEKFKFRHFGHDLVVLHEHEIRKEKGAFNIFKGPEHRQAFLSDLHAIMSSANFILISCVVDKQRLQKQGSTKDNVYNIALAHCMESLMDFLKEKQQEDLTTHVVVECRGNREDKDLELEFRRICDGANKNGAQLPLKIIFGNKMINSSGLQFADLVARPIGIRQIRPEQANRAFDVLKTKFYCSGGRKNVGEGYEDWGLKVYPKKQKGPGDPTEA